MYAIMHSNVIFKLQYTIKLQSDCIYIYIWYWHNNANCVFNILCISVLLKINLGVTEVLLLFSFLIFYAKCDFSWKQALYDCCYHYLCRLSEEQKHILCQLTELLEKRTNNYTMSLLQVYTSWKIVISFGCITRFIVDMY